MRRLIIRGKCIGTSSHTLHQFQNEIVRLEQWQMGTASAERGVPVGRELLVLESKLRINGQVCGPGTWLRHPSTRSYVVRALGACLFYSKQGHLP